MVEQCGRERLSRHMFSHALIQQALYEAILAHRLWRLHREAGRPEAPSKSRRMEAELVRRPVSMTRLPVDPNEAVTTPPTARSASESSDFRAPVLPRPV